MSEPLQEDRSNLSALVEQVASNPKFEKMVKEKGEEAVVRNLYTNFFFREPDPEGLAFWIKTLKEPNGRFKTLEGLLNSQEFQNILQRVE